jgi:hypothetical protein
MKIRLLAATVVLACGPLLGQQVTSKPGMSHTEHVQARGCVRPGKEEGCFVLHDIKGHRYYDLTFDAAGNTPELYTHISFEGIGYAHDAHCSQGRPVHVSSWKKLPGECSKPALSKGKAK